MAWLEQNLKAYNKSLGEWISWSYQKDMELEIYNPCTTYDTTIKES